MRELSQSWRVFVRAKGSDEILNVIVSAKEGSRIGKREARLMAESGIFDPPPPVRAFGMWDVVDVVELSRYSSTGQSLAL